MQGSSSSISPSYLKPVSQDFRTCMPACRPPSHLQAMYLARAGGLHVALKLVWLPLHLARTCRPWSSGIRTLRCSALGRRACGWLMLASAPHPSAGRLSRMPPVSARLRPARGSPVPGRNALCQGMRLCGLIIRSRLAAVFCVLKEMCWSK